jgi:hypothetical protein
VFAARPSAHISPGLQVAVVDSTRTYSYGQLDALSNRLANYLVAKGIKTEDVVTMYAHRSVSIVVGIMGILKAGATFSVIGMYMYMYGVGGADGHGTPAPTVCCSRKVVGRPFFFVFCLMPIGETHMHGLAVYTPLDSMSYHSRMQQCLIGLAP